MTWAPTATMMQALQPTLELERDYCIKLDWRAQIRAAGIGYRVQPFPRRPALFSIHPSRCENHKIWSIQGRMHTMYARIATSAPPWCLLIVWLESRMEYTGAREMTPPPAAQAAV